MPFARTALVSAISLIAAGAMAGSAPAAAQQLFAAPGVTIIVSPDQPLPDAFQLMNAQMAQMTAMMQQMDAQMSAQMAAMSQRPATPAAFGNLPAGVTGVSITTISDGSKTCTARVLYPASGAQQISETGNACGALQFGQPAGPTPSALPAAPVAPKAPTTIVVKNEATAKPILLADRD
jgi:hypothetical protein